MIYIDVGNLEPPQQWLDRAEDVLRELGGAADADARNEIIDRNAGLWGELKDWLLERSHGKCWFSEAKDCFSHLHVEHFRPKKSAKDLDGTVHPGYWWLALDWHNFRICGSVGNTKKGTFFPLLAGGRRASRPGSDLRLELPLLLDPSDAFDPTLLTFDVEGLAKAAAHLHPGTDRERAGYSVVRLSLNFGALVDKRKLHWAECWRRIRAYLKELGSLAEDSTNAVARAGASRAASDIRMMLKPEMELSAVAKACIRATEDPRVTALL